MLLLFAALLAAGPAEATRDWREFDRRKMGVGDAPFLYDAASIRRDGDIVYVWITYSFKLSGLSDPVYVDRLAIDCGRRRVRTMSQSWVPAPGSRGRQAHVRVKGRFRPIASGSTDSSLADRLCRT